MEYGDFQTPPELARASCRLLESLGIRPRSLLEPTCGVGNFLAAGLQHFPVVAEALGFDVNPEYVRQAAAQCAFNRQPAPCIRQADFFATDWRSVVSALAEPLVVFGNPPWVTNAALGAAGGRNLPAKSNFQNRPGIEAITGRSNFDISEYMLIRLGEAMEGKDATLAMLAKTAVARRVLAHFWKHARPTHNCHLFPIDAKRWFGAATDACLFVASFGESGARSCLVHSGFTAASPARRLDHREGVLVADLDLYEKHSALRQPGPHTWRSGIKHDCARVMELTETPSGLVNGLGEIVDLEPALLYPLLKSSAVAGCGDGGNRWMLVPQHSTREDPSTIEHIAPKTWSYLLTHAALLDRRASAIYRKRPRFSIFGVGPYAFAPWKVAISGMYKRLDFRVVGPRAGKPVVFDDTVYLLPCETEHEARTILEVLNSEPVREYFEALIFWDAKRPLTAEILGSLNIERAASASNKMKSR